MEKLGGNALFVDFAKVNDVESIDFFGSKVAIFKELNAENAKLLEEKINKSALLCTVSTMELNLTSKKSVVIDKKNLEDMFRTFSDKDSECFLIENEDGSFKLKFFSGSLSKSYQLR